MLRSFLVVVLAVLLVSIFVPHAPAFPPVNSCIAAMMGYTAAEMALNECLDQYAGFNLPSNCQTETAWVGFYLAQVGLYCDIEVV